jgi:hypothetical protein
MCVGERERKMLTHSPTYYIFQVYKISNWRYALLCWPVVSQSERTVWLDRDRPPQKVCLQVSNKYPQRIWQSQSAQASYSNFWPNCVRQTHTLVVIQIQTIGIQKVTKFDLSSKIGNVEKVF